MGWAVAPDGEDLQGKAGQRKAGRHDRKGEESAQLWTLRQGEEGP